VSSEVLQAAALIYLLMIAAFFLHKIRPLHVAIMGGAMLFDLLVPFYLYMHRDWYGQLVTHEGGADFILWCHWALLMTLYILYALQAKSGVALAKVAAADDKNSLALRAEHHLQARGVLLVRLFVILTGWAVFDPQFVLR